MRVLLASVLFALSFQAQAQSTDEIVQQAKAAYAAREYNADGIARAEQSANLYAQAIAQTSDTMLKASYLALQSEALYFVGNASDAKDLKIKWHLAGIEAGDQAMRIFGVADVRKVSDADVERLIATLSPENLKTLGEALYNRGINLGQWGQANGVTESLKRWPELRANMELIINLGIGDLHAYGPFRTLGRGYHKIPVLLGGSPETAEEYLGVAVSETLASGQVYSVNGYNNTFYAEILKENGKKAQARDLLKAFVQADPNTLDPEMVPETKRSQREAADLLSRW